MGKCNYVTSADGAPCEDGVACTVGDACQTGKCSSGSVAICGDGICECTESPAGCPTDCK